MESHFSLITTLASGFTLALIFGLIAERLKTPALVGYLLAGIVIGPATPGFVADTDLAHQLSEIGVMLLMFGVGLHFSIHDLMAVRRIAVPGAILQMAGATLLGTLAAYFWGWSLTEAIVLGLSLSCASTVVLLKALEKQNALDSENGQIAIGWLVVEDLITVLILVLLPTMASFQGGDTGSSAQSTDTLALLKVIGITLLQVGGFVALMLIVGRRVLPWLLWRVARTGSRELFTLTVITCAIGISYGAAELFNVSFALCAFFSGMVMRESEFSHRAAEESLPLRDAFSVLFFVAVGMLFEPSILVNQPLHLLAVVGIIVFGKSIISFIIVMLFRYPLKTALMVSASLAQIGEFSFILAGLGLTLGLLPLEGMHLLLAASLISIAVNPLLFMAIPPIKKVFIKFSPDFVHKTDAHIDPISELPLDYSQAPLDKPVVLVGYGQVGRRIAETLRAAELPCVVIERHREVVEALRNEGVAAIAGDAHETEVLLHAQIMQASMLVITVSGTMAAQPIMDQAIAINPNLEIVLRTQSEEEWRLLREQQLGTVFYDAHELAKNMAVYILNRYEVDTESLDLPVFGDSVSGTAATTEMAHGTNNTSQGSH
ncbi:cation:proton antiporter [Orrella sp. 11846]|uniref:cation:proton antiporter domain-containing protein n=1 Tax=Orrella sp. 11846 TaxID=3409913 RepID=UPI003B5B7119